MMKTPQGGREPHGLTSASDSTQTPGGPSSGQQYLSYLLEPKCY